jgi:hypothetical protein
VPLPTEQTIDSRSQPSTNNIVASAAQDSPHLLAASPTQINFNQPRYLFMTSFIILSGFLLGSTFALLNLATANTAKVTRSRIMTQRIASLNGDRAAESNLNSEQQKAIQTYLRRMNSAQQEFYVEYGRFTHNLEELERFASVISQSRSYTIKFTTQNKNQAQITAVAKSIELKSYVAIVLLTTTQGIPKAQTLVCETQQAAKTLPSLLTNSLQCPTGMTKLSS